MTPAHDSSLFHFSFDFYRHADPRALHSFPTRRSSDLGGDRRDPAVGLAPRRVGERHPRLPNAAGDVLQLRSEEHTSELQSRFDLVCRLLLEKKKNPAKKHFYDMSNYPAYTLQPELASH